MNQLNLRSHQGYPQVQLVKPTKGGFKIGLKHDRQINIGDHLTAGIKTQKDPLTGNTEVVWDINYGKVTEITEQRPARGVYEDESKRPEFFQVITQL